LVGFDAVLDRLQALQDLGVVALFAGAHSLLLRERLLRLGEILLLCDELLLEDLALAAFGGGALGRRLLRKARGRARLLPGSRRRRGRRRDVDLPGDQLAFTADGLALVVGV